VSTGCCQALTIGRKGLHRHRAGYETRTWSWEAVARRWLEGGAAQHEGTLLTA